jgi:predicted ATPase
LYRAEGIALRGELAITEDEVGRGIESLNNGLETLRLEQYNFDVPRFIGALATGLYRMGDFEEALITVDGAISLSDKSGVKFYLSELLRIRGQILAAMSTRDTVETVNCLEESLTVAREQGALALELRSACTLASWLSERGQHDEARSVLSPVFDQFTEGFETADLTVARRLIRELA